MLQPSNKFFAKIASFYTAVSSVNAVEPTSGHTPDKLVSLIIARHHGRIQVATIDCSAKTTKPPYSSLSILVVVLVHLIVRSETALVA